MIAIAIAALVLPGLALAAPAPVARQTEVGTSIRWQGSSNECLTVEIVNGNANVANGTPLVTRNCAGAAASVQNWIINRGAGKIRLANSNFCLDASINPRNNQGMKLWSCLDVPQQSWYLTDDNHIAVIGDDQCLDKENGVGKVQTYTCDGQNSNQLWMIDGNTPPVVTPPVVTPPVVTPPTATGKQIKFRDTDLCLMANPRPITGAFANGDIVSVSNCAGAAAAAQGWIVNRGAGQVRLAGTDFCLDAGSNPANGVEMKIWQCYSNLPAQNWYLTDDNRIAITGGTVCLDKASGSDSKVQTWTCGTGNSQQVWNF